jgi:cytochrome c oxidase subunit II
VTHHVLEPAGDQAQAITTVWHALFWPSAVIYVAVLAALAWALWRRRRPEDDAPAQRTRHVRRWTVALLGWAAFIASTLVVFTLVSFVQDRDLLAREPDALRVRITGRQWWWQVEYLDPVPSRQVTTANELHLPLGRMTRIELVSDDVIHSLWIPSLNGKQDLIPGRRTELAVTPRDAGRFRGECAEFCGLQHAHMVLPVTVEAPGTFTAWLDARRAPAAPPASPAAVRGKHVFESGPCAMCHAIAGTEAGSRAGPDLTHLASRPTLAAGTLPNDRAHLRAWLDDPQAQKPGTNMPDPQLSPAELADVVAYLEGLR